MTRTIEEMRFKIPAWDNKGLNDGNDNRNMSPTSDSDTARPKGRIRRSMTACNTCRKLKTRCDLDPRGHACRRCLSLRIDCQLPETTERFQESVPTWSDATAAIPSFEERLTSLERSMKEMTGILQQILNRSPTLSNAATPNLSRSCNTDNTVSIDGLSPSLLSKAIPLMPEFQSDYIGEPRKFPLDIKRQGSVISDNVIDAKLSAQLMQKFVDHFGSWISINDISEIQGKVKTTNRLLYSTVCLLGSRYIPGFPPSMRHALNLQVRHAAVNILWEKHPLDYESLQALVLLCLWPIPTHNEHTMDSWLLSGISVQHAIISFDFLNCAPSAVRLDDGRAIQLRLWNTLCLTQLHFSVGNARPFNIQQKYLDHCPRILDHPSATIHDARVVAEIQLYMITLRLQNHIQQTQVPITESGELQTWKLKWAHLLNTSTSETCTLSLNLNFCTLLLYRISKRHQHSPSSQLTLEILHTSQSIVTTFLQAGFSTALGAIDHVYFIVSYAVLTLCDFNFLDPLIDQIQAFLVHLAPSGDHIAYRFADMIDEFRRKCKEGFDRKLSEEALLPFDFETTRRVSAAVHPQTHQSQSQSQHTHSTQGLQSQTQTPIPSSSSSFFPQIFMDDGMMGGYQSGTGDSGERSDGINHPNSLEHFFSGDMVSSHSFPEENLFLAGGGDGGGDDGFEPVGAEEMGSLGYHHRGYGSF